MRKGKTRKVTEMGRLVTRAQLQSAANQIGAVLIEGMAKLEAKQDARLARIEKELGLNVEYVAPNDAKPELVKDPLSPIVDSYGIEPVTAEDLKTMHPYPPQVPA